jgi:hypothetical protein
MNHIHESLKEMNLTEEQQRKILSLIETTTKIRNKEIQKEWKNNHKNEIKEFNKNYYQQNKSRILEKKRENYNKEKTEFCCDTCNFKTNNKKDYSRHEKTNKHINNLEEMEMLEEKKLEEKKKADEEEKKRAMWKYSDAICTNGCIYKRGEKGWSVDGINCEWMCKKCDEKECELLFGSKKNTIIS